MKSEKGVPTCPIIHHANGKLRGEDKEAEGLVLVPVLLVSVLPVIQCPPGQGPTGVEDDTTSEQADIEIYKRLTDLTFTPRL